MHIVELDRPWLETPFLMQGFELRNKSQLRTLEKYCQHVFIRGHSTAAQKQSQPTGRVQSPKLISKADKGSLLKAIGLGAKKKPQPKQIMRSLPVYEATSPVRQEHLSAAPVFRQAKTDIKALLKSAQFGQVLNTDMAEVLVSSCVDSMLRNSDAMLWMSRVKHESEYTAEHCLNVSILAIAFGRHLRFDAAIADEQHAGAIVVGQLIQYLMGPRLYHDLPGIENFKIDPCTLPGLPGCCIA